MSELASGSPPVHDLLLALAGRLDDDLLAWARELLAVGEQNQAVELVTAALAAECVVLPPGLRSAAVAAARAARTDLNVERALPPAAVEDGTPHRFDAAAAPGEALVAALRGLPARRVAGCALHVTWRRTPAGAAPGPVPHAVVLVEADPDRSVEVLAYLLATELDRAGAPASVEVFTAGTALPAYHIAALRDAREVVRGTVADESPKRGRHGTGEAAPDPAVAAPSSPPLGAAEAGAPALEDAEPGAATVRRPAAGRRRRPEPDETAQAGPAAAPASPLAPAPPAGDPLNGPLREPLLAPLLDPTGSGGGSDDTVAPEPVHDDPPVTTAAEPAGPADPNVPGAREVPEEWVDDWRSGEWAMPRTGRPERDSGFDVFGMPGTEVSETAIGLPGRSERTRRIQRRTDSDEDAGAPGSGPRRVELPPPRPGGVSLFESPTAWVEQGLQRLSSTGQPHQAPPATRTPPTPDRPRAVPPPDGPCEPGTPEVSLFGDASPSASPEEPRQGRRRRPDDEAAAPAESRPAAADPESSDLLSSTEHDLLAKLQAEFGSQERRPRPYRRAGQNGAARSVNGHGPGDGDRAPSDG